MAIEDFQNYRKLKDEANERAETLHAFVSTNVPDCLINAFCDIQKLKQEIAKVFFDANLFNRR